MLNIINNKLKFNLILQTNFNKYKFCKKVIKIPHIQ